MRVELHVWGLLRPVVKAKNQ